MTFINDEQKDVLSIRTSNVRRCDSLDPRLDKAEVFSLGGYSDRIRLVVDWISEWQIENFYPKMI